MRIMFLTLVFFGIFQGLMLTLSKEISAQGTYGCIFDDQSRFCVLYGNEYNCNCGFETGGGCASIPSSANPSACNSATFMCVPAPAGGNNQPCGFNRTCQSGLTCDSSCRCVQTPNNIATGTAGIVQCSNRPGTISTAIGCVDFSDINVTSRFFLRWALGIAGGVALFLIGLASYQIATSQGDPRRLQGGQELLLSAIGGLIMIILSVFLLRFIGVDLLGIF